VLDEIVSSLLVSRLGRDLSSSTEQRNISLLMGHIFVGIDKLTTGIKKITVNSEHIDHNNENYSVLSEYYQLVLKWIGHDNGYDSLKRALRGSKDPKASIMQFLYRDFDEQSYCRNYAELIKNEGFEVLETPSEYSKILDVFR
jgi:adenylosuccinate lyase